jgi:hypothetical protein
MESFTYDVENWWSMQTFSSVSVNCQDGWKKLPETQDQSDRMPC